MNEDYAAWSVEFTLPVTEERRYARNYTLTVLCRTLQQAVDRTMKAHPDATLHVVRRASSRGEVLFVGEVPG